MNINLQSLVIAMHVGYTLTGMLLFVTVQLSDWEMLSKKVQEQMVVNPDDFNSDSSNESSSTSLSSSGSPEEVEEEEEEEAEEENMNDRYMNEVCNGHVF